VRAALRLILAVVFCLGIAAGVVLWSTGGTDWWKSYRSADRGDSNQGEGQDNPDITWHLDPAARAGDSRVFVDRRPFDVYLGAHAFAYKPTIKDRRSLGELREAIRMREQKGILALRNQFDQLHVESTPTPEQATRAIPMARDLAFFYMLAGELDQAQAWLDRGMEMTHALWFGGHLRAEFHGLLALCALRRGEIENCLECVGPSTCIYPIEAAAVHKQQTGSQEAVKHFTAYLRQNPGDLRLRWLLNVAYMTLGEYPAKVPPEYLIPLDGFRSKIDIGRFENVAPLVGLVARGPNDAGGSVFDDFNGDDLPDLFTTSVDVDRGASLFINRGDGTFENRSDVAGLDSQVYVLNLSRADFNNDGHPDVLLMRGAWEEPSRLTLLRNKGGGVFEDVTVAAGLADPISTESSVWADYDNDGWVDLFVCGEYHAKSQSGHCRLYHNERDGTFKDVAESAGVTNDRVAKGSAWGDYDGDGRLDLFVSNMGQPARLYHNEGNGRFRDVARELGVTGGERSFSTWFWDYDNDGWLDLFVNDYTAGLAAVVAHYLGIDLKDAGHPHLYRNLGGKGFKDVSLEVGLDWPVVAMGANFGDLDNDGYLDAYFGTGGMNFSELMPNVMLKNVEGRTFEDITESSRTGHLQKGHGVSFADWDCDGDLDVFVELGGAAPGDRAANALFQNPGHRRHWLKLKLIGTRTNRSAFGARIRVDLKAPNGGSRSIHRVIGNNGSFGGNSLVEFVGLGDSATAAQVTISWPTSHSTQTFSDVPADQMIAITEGEASYKVIKQRPIKPASP
jgi:FG-GAP-like repeat/ASPIC and UnbV